jgi:uncharacterized membrane protein
MAIFAACLVLADPFVTRSAVATHDPLWAIALLVIGIALVVMLNAAPSRALLVLALSGLLLAAFIQWRPFWMIYLPPTLIDFVVAYIFARTLFRGRMPLIEYYMRVVHPELPPHLIRHARRLSALWASVMTALGVIAAVLALAGYIELWSVFVNLVSYLVVAGVFMLEYLYRLAFFPREWHTSPLQILQVLRRTRPWRTRAGERPPADNIPHTNG